MKNWFQSLDEREQLFVVLAAVVFAIAVFYLAVWMPLDRGQKSLSSSVSSWRNALADLRILQSDLQDPGSTQTQIAGLDQSLVVVVDETLRSRGLYTALQRSQPTGNNGIRIEFQNAAFDDLVLWLGDLSARYKLQVLSASFTPASRDKDGRVNATIQLER